MNVYFNSFKSNSLIYQIEYLKTNLNKYIYIYINIFSNHYHNYHSKFDHKSPGKKNSIQTPPAYDSLTYIHILVIITLTFICSKARDMFTK